MTMTCLTLKLTSIDLLTSPSHHHDKKKGSFKSYYSVFLDDQMKDLVLMCSERNKSTTDIYVKSPKGDVMTPSHRDRKTLLDNWTVVSTRRLDDDYPLMELCFFCNISTVCVYIYIYFISYINKRLASVAFYIKVSAFGCYRVVASHTAHTGSVIAVSARCEVTLSRSITRAYLSTSSRLSYLPPLQSHQHDTSQSPKKGTCTSLTITLRMRQSPVDVDTNYYVNGIPFI